MATRCGSPCITTIVMCALKKWPCLELAPVLGRQGQLLVLQIIHFILRGAAILIGGMLGDDLLAIQLYSVVSVLLNLTLIGYFWMISGAAPRALGGPRPGFNLHLGDEIER